VLLSKRGKLKKYKGTVGGVVLVPSIYSAVY
jgi:hypothetical protein